MIKNPGNFDLAKKELKNDTNNAVSFIYDQKNKTEGVLNGAVITLKDLFATNDAPTQASSKILQGFNPKYNAEIVDRLLKAGANIVGKTHLDELALGGTGSYSAFGKINNPLDAKRMPGGSSSGAVATMTKNISFAIGSDTGDSVRKPASYCGLVGFKPSYGSVSRFGMYPFASSLDTVSWFAHNVNDIIELSKVLYGVDRKDFSSIEVEKPVAKLLKPQQVAFINLDGLISNFVNQKYKQLRKKLTAEGIHVHMIEPNTKLFELIGIVYSVISFSESSSNNSNLTGVSFGSRIKGKDWEEMMTNTRTEGFGRLVQKRFTLGSYFLLPENQEPIFRQAQKVRRAMKNYFDEILKDYILIYPTATIAPLWSDKIDSNWYEYFLAYANLVGNPSISIPWIKENEMPVNISIDGQLYDDKKLLSSALYLETRMGDCDE